VILYDAARCPFCARVRLVLHEKGLAYETVEIDLKKRPPWLTDLNPAGRIPVLDDGFVLPESAVIMEYLEERYPEHALLPADLAARAAARLTVFRFDELLGDDYYAFRARDFHLLEHRLENLPVGGSLFADFAYVPWVMRLREFHGFPLPERVGDWLDELSLRPSVAAELDLVRAVA